MHFDEFIYVEFEVLFTGLTFITAFDIITLMKKEGTFMLSVPKGKTR